RRLVTYTHWWEKILRRLRVDIILVSLFLVGPSLGTIVESALATRGRVTFPGMGIVILVQVLAQIATLVHLWKTLQAIHQDAALRNNVFVIRGRRKRTRHSSRGPLADQVPPDASGRDPAPLP